MIAVRDETNTLEAINCSLITILASYSCLLWMNLDWLEWILATKNDIHFGEHLYLLFYFSKHM